MRVRVFARPLKRSAVFLKDGEVVTALAPNERKYTAVEKLEPRVLHLEDGLVSCAVRLVN